MLTVASVPCSTNTANQWIKPYHPVRYRSLACHPCHGQAMSSWSPKTNVLHVKLLNVVRPQSVTPPWHVDASASRWKNLTRLLPKANWIRSISSSKVSHPVRCKHLKFRTCLTILAVKLKNIRDETIYWL